VVANVNGVFNGISVTGDVVGTTQYIGQGAGQDATTSAVIGDIADAVALIRNGKGDHLNADLTPSAESTPRLAPLEHIRGCYYLRLKVRDQPGVLAKITSVMAKNKVSIASVIQILSESEGTASLVLTTHESDEKAMGITMRQLGRLASVVSKPLLLRISEFND
jgi:homoserine dehydrogenase